MTDQVARVLAGFTQAQRVREGELVAEIVVLRSMLDAAGVAVPTVTGAEALLRIRRVFERAWERLGEDGDPGQPRELTAEWWMAA